MGYTLRHAGTSVTVASLTNFGVCSLLPGALLSLPRNLPPPRSSFSSPQPSNLGGGKRLLPA